MFVLKSKAFAAFTSPLMFTLFEHCRTPKTQSFENSPDPVLVWKLWGFIVPWMGRNEYFWHDDPCSPLTSHVSFPDLSGPYHVTIFLKSQFHMDNIVQTLLTSLSMRKVLPRHWPQRNLWSHFLLCHLLQVSMSRKCHTCVRWWCPQSYISITSPNTH